MARKSVKGYAEKNYYDNTKFNGGIVATNDPLNEGYFRHLVNFDISDMGQSLVPRKGYLTTTLKGSYTNEKESIETQLLNKQTIYFYDESLGEYIFLDLGNSGTDSSKIPAWRVKFDIENNFITSCTHITNVNYPDLANVVHHTDAWVLRRINPINTIQAIRIVDEDMVTSYIIKVKYKDIINSESTNTIFWLKLYYIKDTTHYGDTEYLGDTLVLSYLDTEDIVDHVDSRNRNIASTKNIIPDPMQHTYTDADKPSGFVQSFPMIYVKDTKDNYLLNTYNDINNLTIIPNYYISKTSTNYMWCYTYSITRMQYASTLYLDKYAVYDSPLFLLDTNEIFTDTQKELIIDEYENARNKALDKYNISESGYLKFRDINIDDYATVIGASSLEPHEETFETYIIFLVPKIKDEDNLETLHIHKRIKDDAIDLGISGFPSYFQNGKVFLRTNDNIVLEPYLGDVPNQAYKDALEGMTSSLRETIEHLNIIDDTSHFVFGNKYCKRLSDEMIMRTISRVKSITMLNVYEVLSALEPDYDFYIRNFNTLENYIGDSSNNLGYDNILQTALDSPLISFRTDYSDDEDHLKPKTAQQVYDKIYGTNNRLIFNVMQTSTKVECEGYDSNIVHGDLLSKLLPNILKESTCTYIFCNSFYNSYLFQSNNIIVPHEVYSVFNPIPMDYIKNMILQKDSDPFNGTHHLMYNRLFKPYVYLLNNTLQTYAYTLIPMLNPFFKDTNIVEVYLNAVPDESLFIKDENILKAELNDSNITFKALSDLNYFETGVNLKVYLIQVPTKEYVQEHPEIFQDFTYDRNLLVQSTSLYQSRLISKSTDVPNTYIEYTKQDSDNIKNANNYLIFNSLLGEHFVIYIDNKLYISKEGKPYYFIEEYKTTQTKDVNNLS